MRLGAPDSEWRLLFGWGRWLRLHQASISFVNKRLPLVAFVVGIGFFRVLPHLNMTRDLGVVQQVNGLLQILAPFFVAALALIAGFPGADLDRPMGGIRPYLSIAGQRHFPSRRELLGYLFSYLAGLSIVVYLVGGAMISLANSTPAPVISLVRSCFDGWLGDVCKALYGATLIHLFAATALGLHFLGNVMSASKLGRSPPPTPPSPSDDGSPLLKSQRPMDFDRGAAPENTSRIASRERGRRRSAQRRG